MGSLLYIIIILSSLVFFNFNTTESRTEPRSPKTTTFLNVAASTKKTTTVFSSSDSLKTLSFNEKESKRLSDNENQLSLDLIPRGLVQRPGESNYRELTISRVDRDSNRVRTLSGSSPVQAPVISGTSEGSGEYFARVGIGSPASQSYVVIDTGSDVSWVQCKPCSECYPQSDPIFDPATSSTSSRIPCGSSRCASLDLSQCRNATCLYEVAYGDGSYTEGELIAETLTLGERKVSDVAIGCGHSNEGLFVGAAGLLALGGGALGFPAQLGSRSFSYCLVDRDSGESSTLDFFQNSPPARDSDDSVVVAALRRNPGVDTFYYLGLTGLKVGGRNLAIPSSLFDLNPNGDFNGDSDGDGDGGGVIIDSGTAVTRLRTEVYLALREAFVNGTRHLESVEGGVSLFDTCYDLSMSERVEVPTVSFVFGEERELSLPAENFMIPVDSNGTYCFAFAPTSTSLSIIGNVQQQGTRVTFDLVHSVVTFVAGDC